MAKEYGMRLMYVFVFYILYALCQPFTASYHKMVSEQKPIQLSQAGILLLYALRLGSLDLFIWISMETLSHLWVTSTAGEKCDFCKT